MTQDIRVQIHAHERGGTKAAASVAALEEEVGGGEPDPAEVVAVHLFAAGFAVLGAPHYQLEN